MDLDRLNCFIETVRCGTVTEAAHKLYIAQPNLSRQISLLEEELGYKLFTREHRRLTLTPAGEYLFNHICHIPQELEYACRQAGEIARQAQTVFSIGLLESEQLLPSMVKKFQRFQQAHPEISISFQRMDFESLRQGLTSGQLDFIFTLLFEAESMEDVGYEIVQHQNLVLAISATHPLAKRDSLTLKELGDLPFLLLNSRRSAASYKAASDTFADADFTPNIVRYTHSSEQLLLLVEIGAGAAVVDENSRLRSSPNVKTFPLPPTSQDPHLCLVWRSETALKPEGRDFIQVMME